MSESDERRTGAWFRRALDSVEDMILIKGPDSRLLWANRTFLDLYGMSEEELIGIIDGPQTSVDQTLQYVRDDQEVFETGRSLDIPAEPVTAHDGTARMFHTKKHAVRDAEGTVVGTIGVSRRMSQLDEVAKQYAKDHSDTAALTRQIRSFVHTLPQPVIMLDRMQRIVGASGAWIEAFGDRDAHGTLPKFSDVYGEALGLGDAVTAAADGGAVRRDGVTIGEGPSVRYYDVGVHPWFIGPDVRGGVVITADDVTTLRRSAIELEHSNRDLEKFAYVASHDLKSPLHGVSQLVRFIEEDMGDALCGEVEENFGLLKRRIVRMQRLLDDLLRFSRAGSTESWVDMSLAEVVEDILAELDLPKLEVTVFDETNGSPMPALGVRQILQNLLANADAHAGADAKVAVRASLEEGGLLLRVEDDGPGISEAFHERVFEMFQTLQPRDRREGSGIGLAIVRRIAEQHRGTAIVESPCQAGRGTRVRVTLRSYD